MCPYKLRREDAQLLKINQSRRTAGQGPWKITVEVIYPGDTVTKQKVEIKQQEFPH